MAMDEALARTVGPDTAVLRCYRWSSPSLSLGKNQTAVGHYDPDGAARAGISVVRRPTGGREVLHDSELTYAVAAPIRSLGGFRTAYGNLNRALLSALRALGAPADLATPVGRTPGPDAGLCFAVAATDEIEALGLKLVGSAQARIGDALLQHGSVPLEPSSVAGGSAGEGYVPSAGTSLSEVLGRRVDFDIVADAIERAMRIALGGIWESDDVGKDERRVAAALLPRYESPSWTWRR